MKRYYVPKENIQQNQVVIDGDEFVHLSRVMRAKLGEQIVVFCGDGKDHLCSLSQIAKNQAVATIDKTTKCKVDELENKIVLFQALVKNEKLDLITQKATELLASKVVYYESARTDINLKNFKLDRMTKIAISACKQCGRGTIPTLLTAKLSELKKMLTEFDLVIFANETENTKQLHELVNTKARSKSIAIIVGPEGGFSPEEVEILQKCSVSVSLGTSILRADTASIVLLGFANLFNGLI